MSNIHHESHSLTTIAHWKTLVGKIQKVGTESPIDGKSLSIATVVAIARFVIHQIVHKLWLADQFSRYGALGYLDDSTVKKIDEGARAIQSSLEEGNVIYGKSKLIYIVVSKSDRKKADKADVGVNTGFGGSADTRTKGVDALQATLIRELGSGILTSPTTVGGLISSGTIAVRKDLGDDASSLTFSRLQQCDDEKWAPPMPESWARAAMLIRINSLASGHSGVRPVLITRMSDLLRKNIVPRIPLRGSISASGDLMPLSYIGGLLQGKPSITAWSGDRSVGKRRIVTADVALAEHSLEAIRLGPKEGLAIINGTAISTGVAALVLHDANNLAVLSQVLTAMSVEALCGNSESFDPFFAAVRPHPGQIEAAQNIHHFLAKSKLTGTNRALEEGSLRQDRYSIRTASQWLGPILEDLLLAHKQITIECNSVTDNPLVDIKGTRMLHGGNFQAKAITSAMEKTRLALQTIGQMLFAQCTEIINPRLNNGLPPNLAADDPSRSFIFKPLDIMIAALQSELGFLANPVGSHVLSAEMGNQALNSLALISARYAFIAIDVLSQLAAAHLFALCQALDLRAMQIRFLQVFEPIFCRDTRTTLASILDKKHDLAVLHTELWVHFDKVWEQTSSLDPGPRFASIFRALEATVLDFAAASIDTVPTVRNWAKHSSEKATEMFVKNRDSYTAAPDARPLLGSASCRMYDFVRGELGVPFVRTDEMKGELSIGALITRIYSSVRSGRLYGPVMECLMEVERDGARGQMGGSKL